MSPDFLLVAGLILGGLAVVAMVSAYSDGRAPRAGAITLLIAGTLVVVALNRKPGGYALADVPQAFLHVIGQIAN